jgi:cytochrome c oxidase subunit 2
MAPPVRGRSTTLLVALASLLAAPAAIAGNGGFGPVSPASPNAGSISTTWWVISGFVVAIFLGVETTLVLFALRYRRRNRLRHADGAQIHGSSRLEILWTIGPVLVVFAVFVVVIVRLPGISDIPRAGASGGPLEVRVSAEQFYWQYTYPNGVISIDRLRAPVGIPVRLTLTSPDRDVIHSWWVPALGGKIDAIPGHTTTTWFQADRAGVFEGRCAELCGIFHTTMTTVVEAMPKAEFDAWYGEIEQTQATADAGLGRELWEGVCAKCHGLAGEGDYGPALSTAVLANAERISTVVRNGGRIRMPAVGSEWTTKQLDSLNAYLQELAGDGS